MPLVATFAFNLLRNLKLCQGIRMCHTATDIAHPQHEQGSTTAQSFVQYHYLSAVLSKCITAQIVGFFCLGKA